MPLRRLKDQRGTVLLFVTALLVFLGVMAGMGIDVAYLASARQELRRSMDAAALAGAGKLGFDDSYFPAARQFAQQFAGLNPYRNPWGGSVTLGLNSGNAPAGDIVLGIWNQAAATGQTWPCDGSPAGFTPSLNGAQVNAVLCRYSTTIPTSFLNLLGFGALPVRACAIAIANPPATVPPGACVFPIGVTTCSFSDAGAFNSQGCGAPITFISSSGATPGTAGGSNTAAWINPSGPGTPSGPDLNGAINDAANGGGCSTSLTVDSQVGTNNGMIQSVFNNLLDTFVTQFNASPIYTVTSKTGPGYTGHGWEVYVPLIQSSPLPNPPSPCPPGPISGNWYIVGWSRFVMTQVIRNQTGPLPRCAVDNPADWNSAPLCSDGALDPSVRGIFGYFECSSFADANPIVNAAPIGALAERIKLVK